MRNAQGANLVFRALYLCEYILEFQVVIISVNGAMRNGAQLLFQARAECTRARTGPTLTYLRRPIRMAFLRKRPYPLCPRLPHDKASRT
jgi:hypothetical protein